MEIISSKLAHNNDKKPKLFIINEKAQTADIGNKIYCKIFIHKMKSYKRIIAFLDSGADISVCQESYFKKLFNNKEINDLNATQQNTDLTSFSNHKILLKYSVTLNISFDPLTITFPFQFNIISDIPNAPPILLGADFMKHCLMTTSYTGNVQNPIPEISVKYPKNQLVDTLYANTQEIFTCTADINLKPFETETQKFYLNSASPVLENDYVLISGQNERPLLFVTASKSQVQYDDKEDKYYGLAFVHSLERNPINAKITVTYEILKNERTIPVTQANKHKLSNYSLLCDVIHSTDITTENYITLKEIPELPDVCNILPSSVYSLHENNKNSSTTSSSNELPESEIEKFYDPKHTAICEPDFDDKGDVNENINDQFTHQIVKPYEKTAEEIVNLDNFQEDHRTYIKDIFIDSYPQVLARGLLESGDLSKTLGYYHLRLKEDQTLPRYKKVFFLNPTESRHMKDILDFLIKNNIIMKSPISDQGDLFGSPAYLIAKSNPDSQARLVIDYRNLNSLLACEANLLPDITTILHSLRGAHFYSKTDLSNAYYSYRISPSSRWLTTFNTPFGQYQWIKIPTGIKSACICFAKISHKMIHEKVVCDENGNPIFEKPNLVKMVPDPINETISYFDDILIFTPAKETYKESVKFHFEKVKKVISRLAFHDSRISFEKSVFCKTKLSFLGWLISNQYIIANPKRVQKLKDAAFPPTQKAMRSWLGMINSLRLALNFKNLEKIKHLTPLTSSRVKYEPNSFHKEVFEELKQKLMERPIFANMIDPKSPKVLFTDASVLDNSMYACILGQIVTRDSNETYVPPYLQLEDPVHACIYDKKLSYRPVDIIRNNDSAKNFFKTLSRTEPPIHEYFEKTYLGFEENEIDDSFFISVQSCQYAYRCTVQNINDMRSMAVKELNKSVLRLKLNDFEFNNDLKRTKEFLNTFKTKGQVDSHFFLIEALSYALFRPFVIISSLDKHKDRKIFKFNFNIVKPPFIFGAYERNKKLIFLPFFVNKEAYFDLKQLRDKFEIIAYSSKSLPVTRRGRSILDHEYFAILASLDQLKRYIGTSDLTLLTDSKPLYLIFHQEIHRSSTRLFRWSLKLRVDYPGIKICYIPSSANLSDFLSKKFNVLPGDLPRFDLKNTTVDDLSAYLPEDKIWTIDEWAQWVKMNPGHLKSITNDEPVDKTISSLHRMTQNLEQHMKPFRALEERISHDNILIKQKLEFKDLYEECLSSKDFTFNDDNGESFKLVNSLIFKLTDNGPKILLPKSMIGLFLAYYHLSTGHGGKKKLDSALDNYIFDNKSTIIYNFVSTCWACQVNNKGTKQQVLGLYPISSYPFQTLFLDLAEDIGKSGKFQHILIATCSLTDCVLTFPLKTKTSSEVSHVILYSILQYFNVKNIFSDNGKCFSEKSFISFLAAMGITKLTLSALHPQGKGLIEAKVKIVKSCLKKMLVSQDDYNWESCPFIISKLLNSSKSNKTNYSPFEFIFGPDSENSVQPFTDDNVKLHPLIQNQKLAIEEYKTNINKMITETREKISEEKQKHNKYINKNKVNKQFSVNDIVFCMDTSYIPGHTRPLKSKFSESPWIVIAIYPSTLMIRRLADQYTQIYSKNMVKKYNRMDPEFTKLPMEVLDILKGKSYELDILQTTILQKMDPFDLPNGINLTTPTNNQADENNISNDNSFQTDVNQTDPKVTKNPKVTEDTKNEENKEDFDNTSDEDEKDEPIVLRSGKHVQFK